MSRAQPGIVCARERLLFISTLSETINLLYFNLLHLNLLYRSLLHLNLLYLSLHYTKVGAAMPILETQCVVACATRTYTNMLRMALQSICLAIYMPCNPYALQSICLASCMPCNLYGAERRDASKLGDIRCRALWQETLAMKMGDSHRSASREEAGEK
jgi:hypothetical protein